jgi:hypothetical protein
VQPVGYAQPVYAQLMSQQVLPPPQMGGIPVGIPAPVPPPGRVGQV